MQFRIALGLVSRHGLIATNMNPDKLFDYLAGKLGDAERAELERQIAADPQLQRELAMARAIHNRMPGDSREVILENKETERGRKMALRVGTAFLILVAVNVGAGLWIIAHHESKNPNRQLLDQQMREQVRKSAEQAAAAFTPPTLGVTELPISVATGKLETIADEVVTAVERLGGSATKQLPDNHRMGILVDVPGNREMEFRKAIDDIKGIVRDYPGPNQSPAAAPEKKSFVVQLIEPATPQN